MMDAMFDAFIIQKSTGMVLDVDIHTLNNVVFVHNVESLISENYGYRSQQVMNIDLLSLELSRIVLEIASEGSFNPRLDYQYISFFHGTEYRIDFPDTVVVMIKDSIQTLFKPLLSQDTPFYLIIKNNEVGQIAHYPMANEYDWAENFLKGWISIEMIDDPLLASLTENENEYILTGMVNPDDIRKGIEKYGY